MKRFIKILFTLILLIPISCFAYEKKEYVYTNLDTKGNEVEKIVNNELILNYKGKVKDNSYLKDILNINGEEKFDNNKNILTWESKGNNIIYEGKTDKKNPIEVEIKYYLNNKEVSYSELMNKKGNIRIEYLLTNNEYNINYNLHVPFVVSLACSIEDDSISNINISNGKAVNTGNRNILVGVAAPGLYDDLHIGDFNSFNKISISFDTDSFTGISAYMIASPKLLENTDMDIFNRLDYAVSSINQLQDGVNKLQDGSIKLNNGMNKLSNGINDLYKGSTSLTNGTKDLNDGLKQVQDGVKQLENGSYEVDNNLLLIINNLEDNKNNISTKINQLNSKLEEVNTLKDTNTNTINKLKYVNTNIKNEFNNNGLNIDLDENTLKEILNNIDISEEKKISLINYKESYDSNTGLIQLLSSNNSTLDLLISTLKDTSNNLVTSLDTIINILNQLENNGTKELYNGTLVLSNGINKLYDGSNQLYNGSKDLLNGTYKLKTGADSLTDGTKDLSDGIKVLNKNGINKLNNYAYNINNYSNTLKNLVYLSKEYNGFASNNATNTIFVYKINY